MPACCPRSLQVVLLVWIAVTEVTAIDFTDCKQLKPRPPPCPTTPGRCYSPWYKIYENDASGNTVFGNKSALIDAVINGAPVRVVKPGTKTYATSIQNSLIVGDNFCAQALLHISKDDYDKFQDKAYWWFVNLCLSGHFSMRRYYVGVHDEKSHNRIETGLIWFVRNMTSRTPILSLDKDGSVTGGSVANVVNAVKRAEDVRITAFGVYSFPVDNLQYDVNETVAGALAIWAVSQKTANVGGTQIKRFKGRDYWWFIIASVNSQRRASRWKIGEHVGVGMDSRSTQSNWFSDPCWKLIYKHNGAGATIFGTRAELVNAIEAGHRVKIVLRRTSLEADELRIRKDHVCGSFLNGLSKSGVDTFESDLSWDFKSVCTTGWTQTLRYKVGNNVEESDTTDAETVAWFIDERRWENILSVAKNGTVLSGSKTGLQDAIMNGREVRYRLLVDDKESGFSITHQADNLQMKGDEVGAMHVRAVSVQFRGMYEIEFQPNPYWWFIICSTTAWCDMSRWTLGKHEDRGHSAKRFHIKWFIDE